MRIQSLEIAGFKSFAERATLVFDRGVSAIVGPNGCGKSNVVDAIRWVMGEQNPRHLRGRRMEDIIFGGTQAKPPGALAEVTLTLDNSDGTAPAGYSGFTEIQVGRKLYRSGESEYTINKVQVRLRDVLDFFLDTGIGTRGYTIVEQGAIAGIVSNKPEERRTIFEEAAGIGKYRQRRREAQSKLKSTEQNLLRVNDILGELRRQIGSLDRQAKKASRYKKLSAQVRDLELAVTRESYDRGVAEQREHQRALDAAKDAVIALDARVASVESGLEAERRAHLDRDRELQRSNEQLFALRSEIRNLENRVEWERREREGLDRLVDERAQESAELEEQLAQSASEAAAAVQELASVEEQLRGHESELQERERDHRTSAERLATAQGQREALQARRVQLSGESATLESRGEVLRERARELELRIRESDEVIEEKVEQASGIERERETLEGRLRGGMAEQDELGRHLAVLLRSQEEGERRLETLRGELASAREARQQSLARVETLREADRRASVRLDELLTRLPEAERGTVRGRLSHVLEVRDGYEAALEAALGHRSEALLVDEPKGALELLGALERIDAGRATALPIDGGAGAPAAPGAALGQPLLHFVEAEPRFRVLLERLLHDVFVVDDLAEVVQRYAHGGAPAMFVTRSGQVYDRAGALTGGSPAPDGSLQRTGEIRRFEAVLAEQETTVDRLEAELAAETARVEEFRAQTENTRSRRHTAELAVVNLERDLERVTELGKTTLAESDQRRNDKARLVEQRDRCAVEAAECEERSGAIAAESEQVESRAAGLAEQVRDLGREVERLESRMSEARVRTAELRARRDQLAEARGRLEARMTETRTWIERRSDEIREARERSQELEASCVEATTDLSTRIEAEEEARGAQEEMRLRFEEGARQLEQLEQELKAAARERDGLREQVAERELAVQEVRIRLDQERERILDRYSIEIATYEPPEGFSEGDRAERQGELKKLRASLDSLGEVHLGAIEEYEEVTERHRYLSEQKADLEVSIERLRNAIARINRTSRTRFRETFEKIDKEFRELFPKMFRGGRAELALTESEDVLEAGIEISAQPPGKKLQGVALLSGGEKSLTALALLMAVFTVRPSPFFLLDEVDAALDDANVQRYDNLLREMSSQSQFLVITHNKSSIESADRLYGVTMQEPGMSKLVRVDLVG